MNYLIFDTGHLNIFEGEKKIKKRTNKIIMSKKYEKKIKAVKERKIKHGHGEKKSSIIDTRNIKKRSIKEQKKALNNIKKKMEKSKKIW